LIKFRKIIRLIEWEALIWFSGLVYLLFTNPYYTEHISICPYKNLGINFCPGCGLGRAIAYLFHGDILNSFNTHPLAIPALILIIIRIVQLLRKKFMIHHNQKEVIYG
jgi:hypothetical protein